MENNTNDGVKIGTNVLICLAIIGIVITFYVIGQVMSTGATKNVDSMQATVQNSTYSDYDNTTVSGSQAESAITDYASSQFIITVKTISNTTGVQYITKNGYTITDITDPNYIEPSATFGSKLVKSNNGSVTGIILTQQ
jgi:hypothetical protein